MTYWQTRHSPYTDTSVYSLRWLPPNSPNLGLRSCCSRMSESATGYTFTPCVGSFTSPGIDTRQKGPPAFSVSSERHRHMLGERNCLSFETAAGEIEQPSPRLTVWRSTTQPPLLTVGRHTVQCVQWCHVQPKIHNGKTTT